MNDDIEHGIRSTYINKGCRCSSCREANSNYTREYLQRSPRQRARVKEYRETRRQAITDAHKSRPCADCGKEYPPYIMDFDHVPGRGDKSFSISQAYRHKVTPEEIELEIAKCDLVCANCHRERTHKRYTSAAG